MENILKIDDLQKIFEMDGFTFLSTCIFNKLRFQAGICKSGQCMMMNC